jgi:hypothetical protein
MTYDSNTTNFFTNITRNLLALVKLAPASPKVAPRVDPKTTAEKARPFRGPRG